VTRRDERTLRRVADPAAHDTPSMDGTPWADDDTLPAVASSAIADVLTGPIRPVRVLAAFPAAVYLAHEDGIATLVAADGIHHPNAVVVTYPTVARPFAGAWPDQRGRIGEGRIQLGNLRVRVARWVDPVPRLRATAPDVLAAAVEVLAGRQPADLDPLPDALLRAGAAVVAGLLEDDDEAVVDAAARLVGAGPGLTPAGDDVLAGLFAAVVTLAPAVAFSERRDDTEAGGAGVDEVHARAVEARCEAVRRVAPRVVDHARHATTTVAAELLRHAARGEVAAPAAGVLHALTGRRPLEAAIDTLLEVGATSGRDLAHGLALGAALVTVAATSPVPTGSASTSPATSPPLVPSGARR
jgi:hypothetical protein